MKPLIALFLIALALTETLLLQLMASISILDHDLSDEIETYEVSFCSANISTVVTPK